MYADGVKKRGIVAGMCVLAAGALACSGGGGSTTATPTPAAVVTVAPTAAATRAPVPDRPASLKDYALTAAQYLSSDAGAARDCLAQLYSAWSMPLVTAADGCRAANTDAEPGSEIVTVFSAEDPSHIVQYEIAILKGTASGYRVAYETPVMNVPPPAGTPGPLKPVVFAGDLLGDGGGALAWTSSECGASTCTTTVHVVRGTASTYETVAPTDGISIESATSISVQDAQGGRGKQIVLTGGSVQSAGAGPPRDRTDTWAWDGSAFKLVSSAPARAVYLYHAITDADALFDAGKFTDAETAYLAAVGDASLLVWTKNNERDELTAWALFRSGVAELLAGGDHAKAQGYLDQGSALNGTLNHQLAGSFSAAYAAKGSVSIGCSAARDDVHANLDEYAKFWDFGYGNPKFDPDKVCPF